jgi:hypothetical protein
VGAALRGLGGREGDGGFAHGVVGVRTEEGKKGPRHDGVVRLLFERGWVRQGGGGGRETRPTC